MPYKDYPLLLKTSSKLEKSKPFHHVLPRRCYTQSYLVNIITIKFNTINHLQNSSCRFGSWL